MPSKVKNIHINHNGQSSGLKVSWTPGQGDLDGYSVSLFEGDQLLEMRPVPENINELGFLELTPGQKYSITIQSISGVLVNNNTASGRTGEPESRIWGFLTTVTSGGVCGANLLLWPGENNQQELGGDV